jgi:hypothetical protein
LGKQKKAEIKLRFASKSPNNQMNLFGKICTAASFISIFVAAICLWFGNTDAVFVVAVLGCVAWFLSYRAKIKKPEES